MTPRRLLLDGLLATLERERQRRTDKDWQQLLGKMQDMAERLAATAHLGPPRTDDLSIAEHMAIALYLPVSDAERRQHEAVVDTWFREQGLHVG
jgi:hypothetical protein